MSLNGYGFREYQVHASMFDKVDHSDPKLKLATHTLGLAGEAGEVVEHIKKHVGHGKELDVNRVAEELGDVLWYVAEIASLLGLHLNVIAIQNINKLMGRNNRISPP